VQSVALPEDLRNDGDRADAAVLVRFKTSRWSIASAHTAFDVGAKLCQVFTVNDTEDDVGHGYIRRESALFEKSLASPALPRSRRVPIATELALRGGKMRFASWFVAKARLRRIDQAAAPRFSYSSSRGVSAVTSSAAQEVEHRIAAMRKRSTALSTILISISGAVEATVFRRLDRLSPR